jgi:small redox-active disulfide protein 2
MNPPRIRKRGAEGNDMLTIEVLGPGCPRCRTLEENVRTSVRELGVDAEITKITDVNEISARGVLMTPGLAVNGEVVATGRLLSVNQVKRILEDQAEVSG